MDEGCSVELTEEGTEYLTLLFHKYDSDRDGLLSPSELANLFSVSWGIHDVYNIHGAGISY